MGRIPWWAMGGGPVLPGYLLTGSAAAVAGASGSLDVGELITGSSAAAAGAASSLDVGELITGSSAAAAGSSATLNTYAYPQVSGLVAWVVADDAHDDGSGLCDTITDRVNGYVFNQGTSANRFTIDSATLAGHKFLVNSTAAYLWLENLDAALYNLGNAQNEYTFFVYAQRDAATTRCIPSGFDDSGTGANWAQNYLGQSINAGAGQGVSRRVASVTTTKELAGSPNTGGFKSWCHSYSYASTANAGKLWAWQNTTAFGSFGMTFSSLSGLSRTFLGSVPTGALGLQSKSHFAAWGIMNRLAVNADNTAMYNWCSAYFV